MLDFNAFGNNSNMNMNMMNNNNNYNMMGNMGHSNGTTNDQELNMRMNQLMDQRNRDDTLTNQKPLADQNYKQKGSAGSNFNPLISPALLNNNNNNMNNPNYFMNNGNMNHMNSM